MQRAAQRADRVPHDQRAKRLRRALVCAAAVPAVLITAACSSDSGDSQSKGGDGARQSATAGSSKSPSASASPTVQAAAYRKLPGPCAVLSKKTLTDLVPEGAGSGKANSTDAPATRGSCSWSSLDNNGVKGSQFRWLNVSLLRFDSAAGLGAGDKQAHAYFTRQVRDAQNVAGAQNARVVPVGGVGAEATLVRYDLKKKEGAFKQQTVVARVENVVVTLDYNGAGLAGEETPDAGDLSKDAEKAAKEAVTAVTAANGEGSGSSSSSKAPASPSASASKTPSKKASASPSSSASPSKSAAKKN